MKLTSIALPLVAFIGGCPPASEEEEVGAEACEHAVEGPAETATAGLVADTTAGDVSGAHTRQDVTLVAVNGGNGGFLQYDSVGGPTTVFLTRDVDIAVTDAEGVAVALDAAVAQTLCPEVVTSVSGDWPVGKVFLELGPTDAAAVSLVIEADNAPPEEE